MDVLKSRTTISSYEPTCERRTMNLKQLEYFVAIAEEGQITAAARRLNITQPPLSYEMRALEQELGAELFVRRPRGVELTDAGRVLYARATAILAMTSSAAREVADVSAGRAGTLSIGVISSSGGLVPNERMMRLLQEHPKISFELHEGNTYEVLEMLRRQVVEVGIVRTPFREEGLMVREGPSEPMVALMTPAQAAGKRSDAVSLEELAGRPLVIYRRFEQIIRNLFETRGLDLRLSCINDDARTTCVWAARGFGIGLVPESFLPLMNLEGVLVKRVDEDALVTHMCLVWQKGRPLSPLAERLVALFGPADGGADGLG